MSYKPSREVLFNDQWLRVVKLNGWFVATEPARSKNNMAVAVLPYRKVLPPLTWETLGTGIKQYENEFLARFELNPAHMTNKEHQLSIITGACETGNPLYHAQQELLEEAGYDIPLDRFKSEGIVSPIKASCTRLHLFSVRIFRKDKQLDYSGDGGEHENKEYAKWVSRKEMIYAKDPYIHTIMMRGKL